MTPKEAAVRGGAPAALREALSGEFATAFIRIRGAHNPTADELQADEEVRPCAWCRLAGEQAAEAAATLRLSENTVDSLDEAWREAEAALPDSDPPWMLTLHTYIVETTREPLVEATAAAPMYEDAVQVFGATPAAALRALARSLSSRATADASEEETNG